MRRLSFGLLTLIGFSLWASPGQAQNAPAATPGSAAAPGSSGADPAADDPLGDDPFADTAAKPKPTAARTAADAEARAVANATDIVVVERRAFLKSGRVELQPLTGVSVNDTLIRHWAFGGELNYFLSEVFAVGVQGMYFIKERTERESLIGLQYNRIPTLNQYLWTAALNFSYLPVYGKFSLFNKYIFHWEGYVSGGAGVTKTEILPAIPSNKTFGNTAITANLGAGARLYVWDWMSLNVGFRDFVFNDKFESTDRPRDPVAGVDINQVKNNADSQFVHNMMLYVGVGFYLPPSFTYRSPR